MFCARHGGMRRNGSAAPFIVSLRTGCKRVARFCPTRNNHWYQQNEYTLREEKNSSPSEESNHDSSVVQSVAKSLQITPYRHPVHTKHLSKLHLMFCFCFILCLPHCRFPVGFIIKILHASPVSSVQFASLFSASQQYHSGPNVS